jgi:hypothetical protein
MCHTRYISCFDKQSESLVKEVPLKPVALAVLREIFREDLEWDRDPLIGYVYVIEERHATALAPYLAEPLDIDRYYCQLESDRPESSRKSIVAAGLDNLLAILDDDQQSGTLYLYNEDGTPSQGVIARTQVYRSEDVPDLRAVNIELGWSDDLTACWVRVGELYRELKVPALAVRSV